MEKKNNSLIPSGLQQTFVNLLKPLIQLLTRLNLNPNTFTVLALLLTVSSAFIIIWDPANINLAGLLILLGGISDILDGNLARNSNKVTKFGALFDSTLDRYAEVAMFFGICTFYIINDHYLLSIVAFAALAGSTMVSYVRARAEGLGFEGKTGFMQRPERVVFIGSGALFHYPLFPITMFHVLDFPVTSLEIAIWLVAILANFTAVQRIIHIYRDSIKIKDL